MQQAYRDKWRILIILAAGVGVDIDILRPHQELLVQGSILGVESLLFKKPILLCIIVLQRNPSSPPTQAVTQLLANAQLKHTVWHSQALSAKQSDFALASPYLQVLEEQVLTECTMPLAGHVEALDKDIL